MEPIEIELKIEELRSAIDELFSLLYWKDSTDVLDMHDVYIKKLQIEDSLDFLEESECKTQEIRELVKQMLNNINLPKILYKIDRELENLFECLKNVSNTSTTNATTGAATDNVERPIKIDVNKIDVNKIDVNKIDVNKIDVNKIDVNKI